MAWHFNPEELRDAHGRWTLAGMVKHGIQLQSGRRVVVHGEPAGEVRPAPGGRFSAHNNAGKAIKQQTFPSRSEAAAHVAAKHLERGPTPQSWQDPPSPEGEAGRKAGGMTAIGVTNTELGDKVEQALQQHLGFTDAHPGKRQGRFDLYWDGHAYEVKAVSSAATEYKAKPKSHEVAEKRDFAKKNGLKPNVMIVVYDPQQKKLFAYTKEGVGAYRLTGEKQGWSFIGTAPLDLGTSWDPMAESKL